MQCSCCVFAAAMLPVCCRHYDSIVLQLDVNRTVNSEAMFVTASYHHKSLLLFFSVAEEKSRTVEWPLIP